MSASELDADRDAFRNSAIAFWLAITEKNSRLANRHSAFGDKLVRKWVSSDRLGDLLLPLLRDDMAEVRYAAAAHLVSSPRKIEALHVLENLGKDPRGLIAPTAKLLLRKYRETQ